ncbi:MAG TPA: hypothetical protein ENI73_07615, partial [Spirochaetes bacterium]|nr:hypothetical protein [Spirochaetota bacterium]
MGCEYKNIEKSDITNKTYNDLFEALTSIEKVYKLDLSDEDLIKFPKDILKLTKLEELILTGNNITEIPPEIKNLK